MFLVFSNTTYTALIVRYIGDVIPNRTNTSNHSNCTLKYMSFPPGGTLFEIYLLNTHYVCQVSLTQKLYRISINWFCFCWLLGCLGLHAKELRLRTTSCSFFNCIHRWLRYKEVKNSIPSRLPSYIGGISMVQKYDLRFVFKITCDYNNVSLVFLLIHCDLFENEHTRMSDIFKNFESFLKKKKVYIVWLLITNIWNN